MKFAISYSFGKDSSLALWRMLQQGHEAVCLIATVNPEAGRSWFHGVAPALMEAVAESLGIPLLLCPTSGEAYHTSLEKSLAEARQMGATACVFGDIDIADHLAWNRARCEAAGLDCITPLWQLPREDVVNACLSEGFRAIIKCVQSPYAALLGQPLDADALARLAELGADLCGENGEYHTFVWNGPGFRRPVPVRLGETLGTGSHQFIDIVYDPQ